MSRAVSPDGAGRDLRRQLNLIDSVSIFVGIILGSGIFIAPTVVAGAAPGLLSAAALWLFGGIVAAAGAFCYAECGARLPSTGGFYVFYRRVYGEPLAFVAGWAALLVTYPASIAAIALIFGQYLRELIPALPAAAVPAAGALAVVFAGTFNALGVRTGAWAQRVLTGTKVGALALLCLAAIAAPGGPTTARAAAAPSWSIVADLGALLGALMVVLWTYDGWSDVTLVSGEIRRPGRDIGRAVLLGIGILLAIYVLTQASVMTLLTPERAAGSDRVLAEAVESGLGPRAGRGVAALIVVSTLGSINGIVLTVSRLGFAMARDGTFVRWFGSVHPRWETPARSVVALVAISLVYVFAAPFRDLLSLFSFSVWIFYALTAVALVVLRRRGVGEPAEWKAPGGWLPPLVVMLTAAAVTLGLGLQDPKTAVTGLALLAAGFPVWLLWRRGRVS